MPRLGLNFMLCALAQIMCLSVYSETCGMSDVSPLACDQDYCCCGKQYDDALSEEQIKEVIRTFCEQALRREVSDIRPLSEPRREELFQVWRQTYQFSDYKSDENHITVDIQTGFVTSCALPVRSSVGEDGPLTEESHAVSIEEAFELAIPILQWYGMPLQPCYYTISECTDTHPPRDWLIRGQMNFDGVLCRSRYFDVYVSLHIPEVSGVWCIAEMAPPERHVATVSRRKALQIAATFMAELNEVKRQAVHYELPERVEDITEIITPPLNMGFSNLEEPTERGYLAHKLYYAWNVPVTILSDDKRIDCFVSVDTETGEIINCGREKQERRANASQPDQ